MFELSAIIIYFSVILFVGIISYSRSINSAGFIMGNRSLNYWLTALSAHASDMSSWLFMAYPAMIFAFGLSKIWIAIGLILFMYCNWHFIASKIRRATESSNSLTFFSYLESRFGDSSGLLRIVTGLICFGFYAIYISAGLVGLGLLIETLFHLPYSWAILISILITLPYVLIGGYVTLAWIDLFQGIFLMIIILFVPFFLLSHVGGWSGIRESLSLHHLSLSLLPDYSFKSIFQALLVMMGWGLGYFGQPAIITKFMGIKKTEEIKKSKWVGMSWMVLSLFAATLVGLIGVPLFKEGLANPEMIFINMVKNSFHPFLIGLILCAIFAASINVMCSQMLVMCSTISEDIYKRIFRPKAESKELLLISRLSLLAISLSAFLIAYFKISTIYSLVLYAWSGLGAAFGPLLIYSLYSKRTHKAIPWAAILSGALGSALWPPFNNAFSLGIDPIIIGFALSFLSIAITSYLTNEPIAVESDAASAETV